MGFQSWDDCWVVGIACDEGIDGLFGHDEIDGFGETARRRWIWICVLDIEFAIKLRNIYDIICLLIHSMVGFDSNC